jgi:flagellar biosynthesis/type III secretory pathway protein FliH
MNELTINADAMNGALIAVVPQETRELLTKVYDAIDLAERRAHEQGFAAALLDVEAEKLKAFDEGFKLGFEESEEFSQAKLTIEREEGYREGYVAGREAETAMTEELVEAAADEHFEIGYQTGEDIGYHNGFSAGYAERCEEVEEKLKAFYDALRAA